MFEVAKTSSEWVVPSPPSHEGPPSSSSTIWCTLCRCLPTSVAAAATLSPLCFSHLHPRAPVNPLTHSCPGNFFLLSVSCLLNKFDSTVDFPGSQCPILLRCGSPARLLPASSLSAPALSPAGRPRIDPARESWLRHPAAGSPSPEGSPRLVITPTPRHPAATFPCLRGRGRGAGRNSKPVLKSVTFLQSWTSFKIAIPGAGKCVFSEFVAGL